MAPYASVTASSRVTLKRGKEGGGEGGTHKPAAQVISNPHHHRELVEGLDGSADPSHILY